MYLFLEEFKMSLESSLRAQSVRHTISPSVESESDFGLIESESSFLVPQSESGLCGVLNFPTLESESESHKKQGLRIPDRKQLQKNMRK